MKKKKFIVVNPNKQFTIQYAYDEFEAIYYAQKSDNYKFPVQQYLIVKNNALFRPYNN